MKVNQKFMPSDIARLVLGYLNETNCKGSAQQFLKESHHLKEFSGGLRNGINYETNIGGQSLISIVNNTYEKIDTFGSYNHKTDDKPNQSSNLNKRSETTTSRDTIEYKDLARPVNSLNNLKNLKQNPKSNKSRNQNYRKYTKKAKNKSAHKQESGNIVNNYTTNNLYQMTSLNHHYDQFSNYHKNATVASYFNRN